MVHKTTLDTRLQSLEELQFIHERKLQKTLKQCTKYSKERYIQRLQFIQKRKLETPQQCTKYSKERAIQRLHKTALHVKLRILQTLQQTAVHTGNKTAHID